MVYAVLRASFGIFVDIGKSMFEFLWEGMKSIWDSISSWVSDKVSWLIDKLAFWRNSKSQMSGGDDDIDGSHAGGLAYVPYDGYVAELHPRARVMTASEKQEQRRRRAIINIINSPDPLTPKLLD